jgi:hypothetical protein
MHYSVKRETTSGPTVQFNCPKCGAAVRGATFEWLDTLMFLYCIPLWKMRNTYVTCGNCQGRLTSQLRLEDLYAYDNLDVTPYISYEVSFVFKFLSIAALLLCWTPAIGLGLTIAALAGTIRVPGWPRTLALVSAVPALAMSAVLLVGAMLGKF